MVRVKRGTRNRAGQDPARPGPPAHVRLLDALPRQRAALAIQVIAGAGKGLFFFQQLPAGGQPLLRGDDAVGGHDGLLSAIVRYLWRTGRWTPRRRARSTLGRASIWASVAASVSNCSCQYLL